MLLRVPNALDRIFILLSISYSAGLSRDWFPLFLLCGFIPFVQFAFEQPVQGLRLADVGRIFHF
jgi:hypothetical protein